MLPVDVDNTQLLLERSSVSEQEVDAIVNAANKTTRG
jgi:hypothetical protein